MSELYEKPLEAAEAKRLDDTLREQAIPDAGLGIEFLDGYLTALICSPVEVDEAEWIEAYMGKALDEMPEDALDDLLGLITRLWNQIDTSLDLGGVEPMIDLDAELPASRWCQGFLAATNLATESWQGLARSQYSALLEPIVVLATARDEAEGEAEQDTLGKRARAVDDLADSVQALYDLWRAPMEPVRVDPRPGRNDPCPCGSGKKYKQCCGKDA